ncbi:hypothetical protein [Pseudomonas sp. RGM2987]|uniref:hypothetical protein n=1 Tax=Pseudomonas sp. RGM2987 TaxID=2930090 RepID=UPI001FD657D2|nr:hypothetical protein [Pseudomonas sp. RGM2987]MCJ8203943.1 hypothetical protein [Pseudomonas sp. RGM2987]
MDSKNKARIGVILEIKGLARPARDWSGLFNGGDFPFNRDKAELAFRDGDYYF